MFQPLPFSYRVFAPKSLKPIPLDGNCLFRALSDQLYGFQSKHAELRREICNYVEDHKDDYAGFVEDPRGFYIHLKCMRQSGTLTIHTHTQPCSLPGSSGLRPSAARVTRPTPASARFWLVTCQPVGFAVRRLVEPWFLPNEILRSD